MTTPRARTPPDAARLERRLLKVTGQAIADFALIEDGDRVLVGLSGGKDSYALLHMLQKLQQRAPIAFRLEAVNLDPGYDGYTPEVVREYAEAAGLTIHMLQAPISELVEEKLAPGQAACPLCSRIRRGSFYTLANRIGANKIALGHHLDDVIETLLMNMFYAGALRAMPPRMVSDAGPVVIRPLCYAFERDVAAFALAMKFPVIPCASPHCAAADRRRQVIKRMLSSLEADHPDIKNHVRRALGNVDPSFLFDRALLAAVAPRDA